VPVATKLLTTLIRGIALALFSSKITARAGSLLCAVMIFCTAIFVLARYLQTVTLARLENALLSAPTHTLWLSLGFTAISFIALGGYDVLAARVIAPARVPAWLAWLAGAVGNAVSNTLGFHVVTGAVARYRLYRTVGLALSDTARIISLSWAALGFGFLTTFGLALLFRPNMSIQDLVGGIGIFSLLAAFLCWLRGSPKMITISRFSFALPSAKIATMQIALGALEMTAAVGALYILMPPNHVSFVMFTLAYIGAVLLGIVSHAPGGIGVFEATMVSLVGGQDQAGVLAALLLYRLIYNLLPFGIAVLTLAGFEVLRRKISWTAGSVL
jgi:uncharacterized membrane protein YbhN (UPF0104 family)